MEKPKFCSLTVNPCLQERVLQEREYLAECFVTGYSALYSINRNHTRISLSSAVAEYCAAVDVGLFLQKI